MKQILISLILVLLMWSTSNIIDIAGVVRASFEKEPIIKTNWQMVSEEFEKLTHAQFVWLGALEWCESRGQGVKAVNPKDKDGTPSYYWWQFKPETFKAFGEKYGLFEKGKSIAEIKELMKGYLLTVQVMVNMIPDKAVDWDNEFPGCVAKLGPPPQN